MSRVTVRRHFAVLAAAELLDGDANRSYRELARAYGFMIDPAPVRASEKKGKVERDAKYLKTNFLPSLDDVVLAADSRAFVCAKVALFARTGGGLPCPDLDNLATTKRGALAPRQGSGPGTDEWCRESGWSALRLAREGACCGCVNLVTLGGAGDTSFLVENQQQLQPGGGEGYDRAVTREFLVTPEMNREMRALVDAARPHLSPRCGIGPWTEALWDLALTRRLRASVRNAPQPDARLKRPSRKLGSGRQLAETTWAAWALGIQGTDEAAQAFVPPRARVLGTNSIKIRVRHEHRVAGQIGNRSRGCRVPWRAREG